MLDTSEMKASIFPITISTLLLALLISTHKYNTGPSSYGGVDLHKYIDYNNDSFLSGVKKEKIAVCIKPDESNPKHDSKNALEKAIDAYQGAKILKDNQKYNFILDKGPEMQWDYKCYLFISK